ncbi:hypothetical protein AOA12_00210 [Microbacterium sp. No. 7]|nr:hypothetical protein AOA12_00210 [Microbacterium sp. No. 7]
MRALTPDEIDELVAIYEADDSTHTLSRRFGIHRTTVLKHLERRGVAIRVRRRTESAPHL